MLAGLIFGNNFSEKVNLYFSYHHNTELSEYLNLWGKSFRLFTSMYLHASFKHLFFNVFALLAFGSIVAKFLQYRFHSYQKGSIIALIVFLVFYNFSGLLASGVYLLLSPEKVFILLGASGSISALLGATIRISPNISGGYLIFPLLHKRVIIISLVFIIFSVLFESRLLFNGFDRVENIAWIVHIIGFISGLIFVSLIEKVQNFSSSDN